MTEFSPLADGKLYAARILMTTINAARNHVMFSNPLLVLRTPKIAFELEKLDAKPPPFDS